MRTVIAVALQLSCAAGLAAQGTTVPPAVQAPASWAVVEGRLLRAAAPEPVPLAGEWVVLHRVGSDTASPQDSMRTGAGGEYRFRYRLFGSADAVYFVSALRGGVAYFTQPLRGERIAGEAAELLVYDTTTTPFRLRVAGRHVVVGEPTAQGRRAIIEVFELSNDSLQTAVAASGRPVWSTTLPRGATGFRVHQGSDVAEGAVEQDGSTVEVHAPVSPGIRQFAFTYELPSGAFPLRVRLDEPVEVLEVLLQEGGARAVGDGLREVPPATVEGLEMRRFLAQAMPAGVTVEVVVPQHRGAALDRVIVGMAVLLVAAMAGALALALRRRRPGGRRMAVPTGVAPSGPAPMPVVSEPSPVDALLAQLAALDAQGEAIPAADEAGRQAYREQRAALKAQVATLLAAESGRP
jgi:hypothetical protein